VTPNPYRSERTGRRDIRAGSLLIQSRPCSHLSLAHSYKYLVTISLQTISNPHFSTSFCCLLFLPPPIMVSNRRWSHPAIPTASVTVSFSYLGWLWSPCCRPARNLESNPSSKNLVAPTSFLPGYELNTVLPSVYLDMNFLVRGAK